MTNEKLGVLLVDVPEPIRRVAVGDPIPEFLKGQGENGIQYKTR